MKLRVAAYIRTTEPLVESSFVSFNQSPFLSLLLWGRVDPTLYALPVAKYLSCAYALGYPFSRHEERHSGVPTCLLKWSLESLSTIGSGKQVEASPVVLKSPPVTTPVDFIHSTAFGGHPPLQPPLPLSQAEMSPAEICPVNTPLLVMQSRSFMTPATACAQ